MIISINRSYSYYINVSDKLTIYLEVEQYLTSNNVAETKTSLSLILSQHVGLTLFTTDAISCFIVLPLTAASNPKL